MEVAQNAEVCFAHSDPSNPGGLPGEPGVRWQRLDEHLRNVAKRAKELALQTRPGDSRLAESAHWAGLLHDLGKYRQGFQSMLIEAVRDGRKRKVPHAVFGAAYAFGQRAYDLALAVLGHHAGLHSFSDLRNKIRRGDVDEARRLVEAQAVSMDGLTELLGDLPQIDESDRTRLLSMELRIRMLFSFLVDADRLDCAALEQARLPSLKPLEAPRLLKRLLAHIQKCADGCPEGRVKKARQDVLNACLQQADLPGRLFSLAVPTGGGKTLSSMAFALRRAALRQEEIRRIIVVIPYLSIIEQNAAVYAQALGADSILEHHSGNLLGSAETEGGSFNDPSWQRRLATENWDAPIVVTTSVRFFESLFSNRPGDLRRVHNIARSLVILDEVQTLPEGMLGTLLSMMQSLSEEWSASFVFCTATQPAFEKRSCSQDDMRWAPGTIQPILGAELESRLFRDLQRVRDPRWPQAGEVSSWEEVADQVAGEKRALCIVNLKRHAQALFEAIRERSGSRLFHLSTRMCAQHRLERLAEIRRILKNPKQGCLVVSTQLVEAGVDLDFPVVFRAVGPLDSVIQAAGRCDREGTLTASRGEPAGRLVLFRAQGDEGRPYQKAVGITESLARQVSLSLHDAGHVRLYFDRLYQGDLDPRRIEDLRKKLDYPEAARQFALIEDSTRAVLVPYGPEAPRLIARLQAQGAWDLELRRRLQRYQVGLYQNELDQARQSGAVFELWPESDIWQCRPSCYSQQLGLLIEQPSPEDYMVTDP